MIPTRPIRTRYAATSRRTRARQAALAALILVPGVACGNDDAAVFQSAASDSTATEAAPPTAADTTAAQTTPATAPTTAPTTSAETTAAETTITTASTAASTSTATTARMAGELAVSFSFVPESSGARGVENPYVAVWVEDLDGNLVQTISLWYEQSGKGGRWLSDLAQWYSASGRASDVTMSGATRVAGDYTVVWDGSGLDGAPVTQGEYVLFVEAAREHGPYEITSQQITIGSDAFTVALTDNGELRNVSAELIT